MAHVPFSSLSGEPAQASSPPVVPSPAPVSSAPLEVVCSRCGGSGRLRINDDSFRTCMDCLGQGVLPSFSSQLSAQLSPQLSSARPAPRPERLAAPLQGSLTAPLAASQPAPLHSV